MNLKDRIIRVLDKRKITLLELCNELELSEAELDKSITNTEVNILEKISKLLKIPLYSFYRDPKDNNIPPNRYYDEDIWED